MPQDMPFVKGNDCTRGSGVTNDEAGLSTLMNSHIPRYSTSGVDYTVGDKTCQHRAGEPPSSPLWNRKPHFDKE